MIKPPSYTIEGVRHEGSVDLQARFSKLIARSPGLGKYVRTLHYKIPRTGHRKHYTAKATQALDSCTRLHALIIEYDRTGCEGKHKYLNWDTQDADKRKTMQWHFQGLQSAFARLLASKSLKVLSLENICLPAYMITGAGALEAVTFQNSAHCT